jgi:hypothetical protein
LVVVIVAIVVTVVTIVGIWICRRFGDSEDTDVGSGDGTSTKKKTRNKSTSDIEMTGDGISRSPGIQASSSGDTADSDFSGADPTTDGAWVGGDKATPPQYATEVHASWHEMMEQAETAQASTGELA